MQSRGLVVVRWSSWTKFRKSRVGTVRQLNVRVLYTTATPSEEWVTRVGIGAKIGPAEIPVPVDPTTRSLEVNNMDIPRSEQVVP